MKDSLGNTPVTWAANFPVQMRQEMAEAAFPCSGAGGGGRSLHVTCESPDVLVVCVGVGGPVTPFALTPAFSLQSVLAGGHPI